MSGKRSRDKGARYERYLVNTFQGYGFAAERVPLSGAAGGSFGSDITVPILNLDRRIEAKKRAAGFKQIYKWLDDNYALIIAADRQPDLVVIPLNHFLTLAGEAEKARTASQEAA